MRLLLVDDNPLSLDSGAKLLRRTGYHVDEAATGSDAVHLLLSYNFDLALIDLSLPDMSGLDVVQTVQNRGVEPRWILFSGLMDFEVARKAGCLGAIRTFSLPIDLEAVVTDALNSSSKSSDDGWWKSSLPRDVVARSAAERWAHLVIRACDADQDIRTISHWAAAVGTSESTVIAACRVLKIAPRRARDFLRLLRALRISAGSIDQLEAALSVADPRTYSNLLTHAGVVGTSGPSVVSLDEYLRFQHFIPSAHCGLLALQATLRQVT